MGSLHRIRSTWKWFYRQALSFFKSYLQCCGSGSGIQYLFDPWIRDPGWLFWINHISESLETIFGVKIIKFFDADPGYGIQGLGWKKFGSGIRDKQSRIRNTVYLPSGLYYAGNILLSFPSFSYHAAIMGWLIMLHNILFNVQERSF